MTFALGTLLVIAATATAILGLIAVRKLVPLEELQANHAVGSIIFGVVGTAYAVLLLMTGTLAVLVSMSLVLAAVLDRRYAGDIRVAPTALQSILGLAQTGVRAPLN